MSISKRVLDRLQAGMKQFCPILQAQRDRDVSEADTVTVVKDILSDVFGYDKYAEVTGEHAIRGTYCDLAIKCFAVDEESMVLRCGELWLLGSVPQAWLELWSAGGRNV